jgi:hypothetical protein
MTRKVAKCNEGVNADTGIAKRQISLGKQ